MFKVDEGTHCERKKNMKRDFYLDVHTILNRIQLTIWTICAFRVLNPHQFNKLVNDGPKVPNQVKAKRDGVINPQNYKHNYNTWCRSFPSGFGVDTFINPKIFN